MLQLHQYVGQPSLLGPAPRHSRVVQPSLLGPGPQFQCQKHVEMIRWDPSSLHFTKINTDANVRSDGTAGYGGLARDCRGLWMFGFCGFLGIDFKNGVTSVVRAELNAVLAGLRIARARNLRFVIIESDCKLVVHMIETVDTNVKPKPANEEDYLIIQECQELLKSGCCYSIQHKKREANFCADKMATLGVESDSVIVRQMSVHPPPQLLHLLNADRAGVAYPRGTKL